MRSLIAVAFIFLAGSHGEAAFLSADALRHDCNAKLGDRSADFQRCLWYVAAIHDAMQDGGPINGRTACFPNQLIVGDLIRPVVEFIDKLREPKTIGAGGAIILALSAAYSCNDRKTASEPHEKYVEMNYLRANMKDYVGKVINTSGYIRCLASIDDCQVESEAFSTDLMPYLVFDIGILSPTDRAIFFSKCKNVCYFSGIATVEPIYRKFRLKPSRVTFQTLAEKFDEKK